MGKFFHLLLLLAFIVSVSAQAEASKNVTVKVGRKIVLECAPLAADEQLQTGFWYKEDVLLSTMGRNGNNQITIPTYSTRMKVTDERHLEIGELELKDSALYTCELYVKKQDSDPPEITNTSYTLTVQDKPGPPGKPELSGIESRMVTVSWAGSSQINNSPITKYTLNARECRNVSGVVAEVPVNEENDGSIIKYTVDGLNPYTCYHVFATAINSVGPSLPSRQSDDFYTEPEGAGDSNSTTPLMLNDSTVTSAPPTVSVLPPVRAPYNFRATPVNSTEILLEWEPPPDKLAGADLEAYLVSYGTSKDNLKSISIDPNLTETLIQGLAPYTLYMVKIMAKNSAGSGPETALSVRTNEGVPSQPRITHLSARGGRSFIVHWEPPIQLNGKLVEYKLKWSWKDESPSRIISGHLVNPMSALIDNLKPYTQYDVQVAAATNGGQGLFSKVYPSITDIIAPSPPLSLNVTEVSPTSVVLRWERPAVFYKQIDNYIIRGWNNRGKVLEELVNGSRTDYTLSGLTRNSRYHVKVSAVTKSLFSDKRWKGDYSPVVNFTLGELHSPSKKDSGLHPGIIVLILLICGVLLATAIVVLHRFYNCRRCYQETYRYFVVPSNGMPVQQPILTVEEMSEEKQYPDISVADFLPHVEHMHSDSDIGFSQEFDEINRSSHSAQYSFDNSNLAENKNKNRYINIVAYDHSRVIMKTELGRLRQTDYINANYVDGYTKPKAYIATQGPLPQTFSDFWRMVWEQNTNVIVMITNLMEKGRRKCDQYWPNDGQEMYGNMQVKLITTVPRAHYTVRIFSLRNMKVKKRHSMKGSAERTVYHYHYTEWPDHGVPDYSLPVLSFVQKSAAQSGPENGPIIVHCSAGVGRTGTYILIDSMIAQIEDKQSINIPGFTQHIRRQRNFLVQTEDQYIFIHEVLKEYLLANGVTEVREDQMGEYLQKLEQPIETLILTSFTKASVLERQYQLLTEYTPNELDLSAALKPVNQEKNRVGSILPVNMKRVLLPARPGVDGSDYINATFLHGYKKSSEFIVTQHPTEDTMEDFWRMVWDKNSPVIVVLSDFDDLEYKEFWPPKGSSIEVDSGNFRLVMKDEPNTEDLQEKGISILEFILDSIQYDYTLMTRIIFLKSWPTSSSDVFDPIILAHSLINSLECGPIVVMDRYGGVEAGAFCALWTLRDQMLSEKCCDFYEVCKLYHYKRPGIVGTQEDYMFLHRAMSALCTSLQEEHSNNSSSPRHHHHYHFPSLHGGSSSRQNGTLPRQTPNNSSSTTTTTNNITPNNVGSGSHTLPRASSTNAARRSTTSGGGGGGGSGEGSNSAATTPTTTTAPEPVENKETNI